MATMNASAGLMPETAINCAQPTAYVTTMKAMTAEASTAREAALLRSARPSSAQRTPTAHTAPRMKPHRKPPVGPTSIPRPPRMPLNTGNPSAPSSTYPATAATASFGRSAKTENATAKVCSVNGTGPKGTVTHAHTAMTAMQSAQSASERARETGRRYAVFENTGFFRTSMHDTFLFTHRASIEKAAIPTGRRPFAR